MVYLDYNASTPVDPRVAVELSRWTREVFANPSSGHSEGRAASALVKRARAQVAGLTGRRDRDVIFTSGASESASLALLGIGLSARGSAHRDFLVNATEHKAIMAAANLAASLTGGTVRVIKVDGDGLVDLEDLRRAVRDHDVCAVVTMLANNETGVINPISDIQSLVPDHALLVVDLTQAAGKIPIDSVPYDIGFFSSHKMYGPKGAGALLADRRTQRQLTPVFPGGGQENGLRGGTQAAPLLAGFGLAAEIAAQELSEDSTHCRSLMNQLLDDLRSSGLAFEVYGDGAPRIPNTLNVRFPGADAEAVMANATDIQISDGSACTSAQPMPSHVLMAMGLDRIHASESLRISVGRFTTCEEVRVASKSLVRSVHRVLAAQNGISA